MTLESQAQTFNIIIHATYAESRLPSGIFHIIESQWQTCASYDFECTTADFLHIQGLNENFLLFFFPEADYFFASFAYQQWNLGDRTITDKQDNARLLLFSKSLFDT